MGVGEKEKKRGIVAGPKQPLGAVCCARPGFSTVVINSISFAT